MMLFDEWLNRNTNRIYVAKENNNIIGYIEIGVDCETLNPNALRFWGKHFDNYTYSFARRIDERIIGYDKYLESACK